MSESQRASDRLSQMVSDTISAAGLSTLDTRDDRGFTPCTSEPDKGADSWVIHYPSVEEDEARRLMREVLAYWESVGEQWAQEGFDVVDDGIGTKSTPAVYLNIDGYSLGASYFPDAEIAAFQLAGTAPCVDRERK